MIMMAPSRSIMRRAESRAASALVWVSPVTETTFLPRMPLPFSVFDEKVDHAAVAAAVEVLEREAHRRAARPRLRRHRRRSAARCSRW